MAATSGGAGGDKVELHDGFIPAVTHTVDEHETTAAAGAVGIEVVLPEGVDPISAEIVTRMSGWGGERLLTMGNVAKSGAHLGAAAGTTAAGLTAADGDNAATISAAEDV